MKAIRFLLIASIIASLASSEMDGRDALSAAFEKDLLSGDLD